MIGIVRNTLVGAAVAATALVAAAPANAGGHWHHRGYYHHHHSNGGDLLAAGILGAAVGAIATGALAQPAPVYADPYPPAPPVYYRPAPRVVYVEPAAEPWTREWYRDCSARYRSFDPGSGTYLGYDGQRHFCDLN